MNSNNTRIFQYCFEHGIEPVQFLTDGVRRVFEAVTARKPEKGTIEELKNLLGEGVELALSEGMKPSTYQALTSLYGRLGPVRVEHGSRDRELKVVITGQVMTDDPDGVFQAVHDAILRDGYYDSWTVTVNGEESRTVNLVIDREIASRKERDAIINGDDVLNIKIALESTQDVLQFLESI